MDPLRLGAVVRIYRAKEDASVGFHPVPLEQEEVTARRGPGVSHQASFTRCRWSRRK